MFLLETIQRESVIRFPFLGNLTLNPPASFSVFGREIYFYGVIIALGFVLGILYCAARAPEFGIRSDDVYDDHPCCQQNSKYHRFRQHIIQEG